MANQNPIIRSAIHSPPRAGILNLWYAYLQGVRETF